MGLCLKLWLLAVSVSSMSPSTVVFSNGAQAPGLDAKHTYHFGIPALTTTPKGSMLAFAQAYMSIKGVPCSVQAGSPGLEDGNDGWIDIVMRRSSDQGRSWGELQVICRNSTGLTKSSTLWHSCQQPAPVSDRVTGKVFLLTSLDNYHQLMVESEDDGTSFTPWKEARNLDPSLRLPGWGLVFTGLPGGIQLAAPSSHPNRMIICSSAYWVDKDTKSRYSYTIISDDSGKTWQLGSGKIGPMHTTECSIAQSFDDSSIYMYSRIWDARAVGVSYKRGIAKSADGGKTWTNATLSGLGDTAPDCEGSMISSNIGPLAPASTKTCFFVSSPYSTGESTTLSAGNAVSSLDPCNAWLALAYFGLLCFLASLRSYLPGRKNLTVQTSCAASPTAWGEAVVVESGPSSYSSLAYVNGGGRVALLDMYMCTDGIRIREVDWKRA
jgi:sialidase-1